jgi:ribosomal protein S18 acetylase RimI-like enzyme
LITYSQYKPSDAFGVIEIWNAALGEMFPLDLRLWRQNVDDSSYTMAKASYVARDDEDGDRIVGFLIVKAPKHVSCIAVSPPHQRNGIGSGLFAAAESAIGADSGSNWLVGQDHNHFFPGVPLECESALSFFERRLGFKRGSGLAFDVVRDLDGFEIEPTVVARIGSLAEEGIVLAPCQESDLPALADHIGANFSKRWLSDTIHRLSVETNPREIIVAKRPAVGDVVGFAHTYSNVSRHVGPSISWRALLGPKYAGLGPIGVDKDLRKIGLGLALLSFAVQSVKDRGATRMAIDWTELVDFYGKLGFKPWKRYVMMRQEE